jgi:hypothetical protein
MYTFCAVRAHLSLRVQLTPHDRSRSVKYVLFTPAAMCSAVSPQLFWELMFMQREEMINSNTRIELLATAMCKHVEPILDVTEIFCGDNVLNNSISSLYEAQ